MNEHSLGLGYQTTGLHTPVLSLSNYVAMGNLFKFFLSFQMFKMEIKIVTIKGLGSE